VVLYKARIWISVHTNYLYAYINVIFYVHQSRSIMRIDDLTIRTIIIEKNRYIHIHIDMRISTGVIIIMIFIHLCGCVYFRRCYSYNKEITSLHLPFFEYLKTYHLYIRKRIFNKRHTFLFAMCYTGSMDIIHIHIPIVMS